jgi:hypothetical protein
VIEQRFGFLDLQPLHCKVVGENPDPIQ